MRHAKDRTKKFLYAAVILSALFFTGTTVHAAELYVGPGEFDFETIQAAIDRAISGDVVVVADGTYTGFGNTNITYRGKAITVRSENGPDNCIILGEPGARGFVFQYRERATAVLSGFTIKGFSVNTRSYGGAIFIYNASPTIENCIIRNNAGGYGGAIAVIGGSPLIQNCMIFGNYADYMGGGVFINYGAYSQIINCTIADNQAGYYFGAGVYARSVYRVMIVNTIVWRNGIREIVGSPGLYVLYSNVMGGYPGSGNFSEDPEFVKDDPSDEDNGDYRLKSNSPCINRGLSIYAPDYDIDRETRPQGPAPDVGADEVD